MCMNYEHCHVTLIHNEKSVHTTWTWRIKRNSWFIARRLFPVYVVNV